MVVEWKGEDKERYTEVLVFGNEGVLQGLVCGKEGVRQG